MSRHIRWIGLALGLVVGTRAGAADYTGTIDMLEVWESGNVAFTLNPAPGAGACAQQFVINKNMQGARNLFAAVLAAKKTGTPIRVVTSGCGPAFEYGSTYNLPLYIYVHD